MKRNIIKPSKDNPEDVFHYIGLGDIESKTGRIIKDNAIKGKNMTSSYNLLKKGDVIYAKLRPYLKKCIYIENDIKNLVCSSEFIVFSPRNDVDGEYLSYILRTDLVHDQINHLYSGVGRPRISKKYLVNIKIPMPVKLADQKVLFNKGHDYELKSIEYKTEAMNLQKKAGEALEDRDAQLLFEITAH